MLGKAGMKGFKHFIYIFKTSLLFFVCRLLFSSELKNKVNNMKKYAKENYINNIDNIISNYDTGNSSKTFWQIMGRFIGKNNTSTKIPPLHIGDNEFAFSNQEKADALNNIFISVSDIEEAHLPLPNFNSRTESVLSQIQVSESEVKDILNILLKLTKQPVQTS